jgi:hypothetical protein
MTSPPPPKDPDFGHFVRAGLAIGLTISLPFVVYLGHNGNPGLIHTYEDALAAVVAFYFGASSGDT